MIGNAGGVARARSLSPERRKEIATEAANARWASRGEARQSRVIRSEEEEAIDRAEAAVRAAAKRRLKAEKKQRAAVMRRHEALTPSERLQVLKIAHETTDMGVKRAAMDLLWQAAQQQNLDFIAAYQAKGALSDTEAINAYRAEMDAGAMRSTWPPAPRTEYKP